jgi:inner membrane protein
VENVTHSLLGAVLASAALPDAAARPTRRLFLAAGIAASNAPDLDLLYTSITPAPLGYLLQHRGHTHTLVGLIPLAVGLALATLALPAGRQLGPVELRRLCLIIVAGLAGHLAMDATNWYGVHPFFPIDNRWYYGDALFIFEPWLWLILGLFAAMNTHRRLARAALIALVAALPIATGILDLVPWPALGTLTVGAVAVVWSVRHWSPRSRAAVALSVCAVFIVAMVGLSRAVRAAVRMQLEGASDREIVDLALSPSPAFPLCWAVIAIEKNASAGVLSLRRGSLTLLPAWHPAASCPLNTFVTTRAPAPGSGVQLVWTDEYRLPLSELRALARDCWSSAWLRFARAPVLDRGRLFDLRFESEVRGNFTSMSRALAEGRLPCPANIPEWTMPRTERELVQ